MRKRLTRRLACALAAAAVACSGGDEGELSELAQQGRRVYLNVCIACHNGDPSQDGSLGPAIAGSSRQLLYARVIEGSYPEGYEPKRPDSGAMPRFEYLKEDIDALAAYLSETPQ